MNLFLQIYFIGLYLAKQSIWHYGLCILALLCVELFHTFKKTIKEQYYVLHFVLSILYHLPCLQGKWYLVSNKILNNQGKPMI